jgi:hypothetical protein
MSFESMKKPELVAIAEEFGVELQPKATSQEIIAELADEGITWAHYQTFQGEQELPETPVVVKSEPKEPVKRVKRPDDIIVKMNRGNFHFEVFGKTFTKEHPFAVCTPDEAQAIIDAEDGFSVASPREAAEYYS